jgi:hypothetical protein
MVDKTALPQTDVALGNDSDTGNMTMKWLKQRKK